MFFTFQVGNERGAGERRMSNQRKVEEYINGCLAESKDLAKLMREKRLRERKAYKGRRLRRKDDTLRSD